MSSASELREFRHIWKIWNMRLYEYIAIFWKENKSDSQWTVSAYRTFRKLIIFNFLILILINLQEVINFNTVKNREHTDILDGFQYEPFYSFKIWHNVLRDFIIYQYLKRLVRLKSWMNTACWGANDNLKLPDRSNSGEAHWCGST